MNFYNFTKFCFFGLVFVDGLNNKILNSYSLNEMFDFRNRINGYLNEINKDSNITKEYNKNLICEERAIFKTALIIKDLDRVLGKNFQTDQTKEIYLERPPFLFYTDKEGKEIMRMLGVIIDYYNVCRVCVAVGDVKETKFLAYDIESLIPIKKWNEEQLELLKNDKIKNSEIFNDKFGYLIFSNMLKDRIKLQEKN